MSRKVKKLVAVLATSILITKKMEKTKELEQVPCIQYSIIFKY